MTSAPDGGSAAALVDDLAIAARSIERIVRKYAGVLDLRERQLCGAAALGDARRRNEALQETSTGYAADLRRYAAELGPHVLAFGARCAELQQYSALQEHPCARGPAGDTAGRAVGEHIRRLKMARATRDAARAARRAVAIPHALGAVAGGARRQVQEMFDRYLSALDAFEGLSLDALERLGAEARSPAEGAHGR